MQQPPIPFLEAALAEATMPVARARALDALATDLAKTGHGKRALALAGEARTIAESSTIRSFWRARSTRLPAVIFT